jgi:myo-inositol-1-phosphate synthase
VPVAAFDINANKAGKDLNEAICGEPNNAYRYPGIEMKPTGVPLQEEVIPPHSKPLPKEA